MYFVKVTFVDGIEEIHKVGETELPRDDKTEATNRVFMYVLSFLAKRKVQPIILKIEFVDPQ